MIILDISMPNLRGIEATKEVKRISENIKVLILTVHKKKEYLYYLIYAGTDGYILKEEAITELFSAIKIIREGSSNISLSLNSELTRDLIRFQQGGEAYWLTEPLSVREKEDLMLIAEGMSNKEIAKLLTISINTVQNHRSIIKKKLNAKNTANLVRYTVSKGYV